MEVSNYNQESCAEIATEAQDPRFSSSPQQSTAAPKNYVNKYNHLLEFYNHVSRSNNRLRHRIYHVKKEINHLKRLKRVLCERLMGNNAVLVDFNLEIPDVDSSLNRVNSNNGIGGTGIISTLTSSSSSSASVVDRVISDVVNCMSAVQVPKKRRRLDTTEGSGVRRRERPVTVTNNTNGTVTDSNTERNIIAIIDSVVNETHESTS